MRVFISYRRSDIGGYAGRLNDGVTQRLGAANVFHDVTDIAPGRDFRVAIGQALDRSDALLAVIGPTWLTVTTPEGTPRLMDPGDHVRLEISTALERGIPVTPVLVGGARLPSADELPEDLRPLAYRQAVTLHDESWHDGVERLLRQLQGPPPVPIHQRREWRIAAGAIVALLVIGGGAWWIASGGDSGGGEADAGALIEVPPCGTPSADWVVMELGPDPTGENILGEGETLLFRVVAAWWRPLAEDTYEVVLETSMANAGSSEQYHDPARYDSLLVSRRPFEVSCFSAEPDPIRPDTIGDALVGFEVACHPAGSIELILEYDRDRIGVGPDDSTDDC